MRRFLFLGLLAAGDAIALAGSFLLAYHLRFGLYFLPNRPMQAFGPYAQFSILVALIGAAIFQASGMYQPRRLALGLEELLCLVRGVTFTAFILMAMNYAFRGVITRGETETFSRLILMIWWAVCLVLLTGWRTAIALVVRQLHGKGWGLRSVVIVGTGEAGRRYLQTVREQPELGYRALGFVASDPEGNEAQIENLPIICSVDELPAILRREHVDEVVLAAPGMARERIERLIVECDRASSRFSLIPGFVEILTRRMAVLELGGLPVYQVEETVLERWGRIVKRTMDIAVSLTMLVALTPLLALVAAAIKLDSRGPILYRQGRVGKGERVFPMYKFRSMTVDADDRRAEVIAANGNPGALLRAPEDPRVTRIGRVLRRWSIDELPQLINVLKGDMSLVGPRPHIPAEVARYQDWHLRKYDVLPGITGFTQVSGRKDLSLDEMVRLDIHYIENWSPLLDVKILLKTVPVVLGGRGAY